MLSAVDVRRVAAAAWGDGWGLEATIASFLRDAETVDDAVQSVKPAWAAGAWIVSPFAIRLKKAGSEGKWSGNVQRDTLKAAELAGLMEELSNEYVLRARGSAWNSFAPTLLHVTASYVRSCCLVARGKLTPSSKARVVRTSP